MLRITGAPTCSRRRRRRHGYRRLLDDSEGLREYRVQLLCDCAIQSFVHLRDSAYHADVFGANSAFVLMGRPSPEHSCPFVYLEPLSAEEKRQRLFNVAHGRGKEWEFVVPPSDFHAVPGSPISYRLSAAMRRSFVQHKPLSNFLSPKQGIKTGDNDRFLRYWWEVSPSTIQIPAREVLSRDAGCGNGAALVHPCQKVAASGRWHGSRRVRGRLAQDDGATSDTEHARPGDGKSSFAPPQPSNVLFQGGVDLVRNRNSQVRSVAAMNRLLGTRL